MANQVPQNRNRIELHDRVKDKWGRPVAYILKDWHAHDSYLMNVMAEQCARRPALRRRRRRRRLSDPGPASTYMAENALARMANHILGGARFGTDPNDSVLDPNCRAWQFDNLYVTDGSFMPTSGGGNPTLTIQANAFRVADAPRVSEALRRPWTRASTRSSRGPTTRSSRSSSSPTGSTTPHTSTPRAARAIATTCWRSAATRRLHRAQGRGLPRRPVPLQLPAGRYRAGRLTESAASSGGSCARRAPGELRDPAPADDHGRTGRGDVSSCTTTMDRRLPGRDLGDARAAAGTARLQGARSDGPLRPITSVSAFNAALRDIKALSRLEWPSARTTSICRSAITISDRGSWDNNYTRNPPGAEHAGRRATTQNTVEGRNYLIDFRRGWFVENATTSRRSAIATRMMDAGNPDRARRQRHRDALDAPARARRLGRLLPRGDDPAGAIEGTHQHIGSGGAVLHHRGQGVAYMGEGDDPADRDLPDRRRAISTASAVRRCKECRSSRAAHLHQERRHSRHPEPRHAAR